LNCYKFSNFVIESKDPPFGCGSLKHPLVINTKQPRAKESTETHTPVLCRPRFLRLNSTKTMEQD